MKETIEREKLDGNGRKSLYVALFTLYLAIHDLAHEVTCSPREFLRRTPLYEIRIY